MATPTPGLTPGQQSFYDILLEDDKQAAEDFKANILSELERDAERARPPAELAPSGELIQGDTPINIPEIDTSVTETNVEIPMPPSPNLAREEGFDEAQISFYEALYDDDPGTAVDFIKELIRERDADLEVAVKETALPQLVTERTLPGFDLDAEPIPTPPENEANKKARALDKARFLIQPGLLDEEQRAGYDAAIVRYVSEGLPDEDALAGQYGIEFDQDYEARTGEAAPEPNAFSQEANVYSMEKGNFIQGKLDLLPETAQDLASAQFFGPSSPRKPRAVGQYEVAPTPVRPGMIQRNPELADDMSLGELASASLAPQVITTADELKRQREPKKLAKKAMIDNLTAFGEASGLDVMDETARLDIRQQFFESYRQNAINEIISTQLGNVEGVMPTSAPFFFGYTREEMDELEASVTPQANAITREAIKLTFRPIDSKNSLRENTPTTPEKELNELFPIDESFGELIDRQVLDPLATVAVEGLTALTTSKYSPEFRQSLYESGFIENPDSITESAPMMIIRDVAGILRLVVNPAISGAENLGMIERKSVEDEVETILPAQRREYTEQVEFDAMNPLDSMYNLGEAYLKEVLVETATMRSLGNDIGQLDSAFFGLIDENTGTSGMTDYLVPDALVPSRNFLVGAGTLAEAFIPITKGGAVRALGAPTKALSKAPRATKAAITQRTLRPDMATPSIGIQRAEGLAEFGLDVVAGGGNPLFALVKAGNEFAPGIAKRAVVMSRAGTDVAKITKGIDNGEVIGTAFNKAGKFDILTDTATVEAKVLNNLADPIAALELRARSGLAAVRKAYDDGLISIRSANMAEFLTVEQAEQALEQILKSETEVLSSMAERAMIGSQRSTYNYSKALQRRTDITGAGAEELTKFGLGDYVLLTDRTVVKKSWLDNNKTAIDNALIDSDGKSKLFSTTDLGDGRTLYKLNNPPEIMEIAVRTSDGFLEELAEEGLELLTADTIYITNRVMDDIVLRGSDTAFVARKASTLEAAATPLELRNNLSVLSNFYEAFTFTSVKKQVDKASNWIKNKPTNIQAQTAQTSAVSLRFSNQVNEGVARLERTMKGAYGQTSRNIGLQKEFGLDFAAELVGETLGDNLPLVGKVGGARTAAVYQSVYLLQKNTGMSLADISTLTPERFKEAIDIARRASDRATITKPLLNKDTFETYLNTLYGVDLRSNSAVAKIIEDYGPRAQVTPFRIIPEAMEEINAVAPHFKNNLAKNNADAIASMTANLEMKRIVKRAVSETFGADDVATNAAAMNNRLSRLSGYNMTLDRSLEITEDLVALRMTDNISVNTMSPDDVALFYARNNDMERAYTNYLRQSPSGPTMNRQQFLAQIDGGSSNTMADYLEVTALKRNLSPEDLAKNYGVKIRQLTTPSGIPTVRGKRGVAIYPLTNLEKQALEVFTEKLGSADAKLIADNISQLRRNKSVGEAAFGMLEYGTNGMRRTFVSGMLGGKYAPNIPYQMENLLTANLITYVTNPKYWPVVMQQTAESAFGLTPYRKLRYMAGGQPDSILPGTRFTYAQVYEEFTRRNLGVSNAGLNLGDSFYADLAQEAKVWGQMTKGIPGYKSLPDMLKNDKGAWLEGMLSYFRKGAQDLAIGPTELARPFSPTTSPYMKWADETDRAFREAIFVKALQNGESVDTAANLARRVMLDYGSMPTQFRQGALKSALFLSFTYASSAEMFKAMTTTNGALRVAAMASYHRDLNRYYGTYYSGGTRTLESVYINEVNQTDPNADKVVNTYMRSPYLGNLINVGKLIGFGQGIASGRSEDTVQRTKEGLADFFYMPALQFAMELDADYKKGVSGKQMLQLQTGYFNKGFWTMSPPALLSAIMSDGGDPYYFIDRYDIEVRPMEKRIPGSPEFGGGYQYRFRSTKGHNMYLLDQLILATAGTSRGFNDYFNAAVMAGLIDIPEGTDLSYQGPLQQPLLTPSADYLFLKGRPVRIPQDIEIEYRAVKESERRLIDKRKIFEK